MHEPHGIAALTYYVRLVLLQTLALGALIAMGPVALALWQRAALVPGLALAAMATLGALYARSCWSATSGNMELVSQFIPYRIYRMIVSRLCLAWGIAAMTCQLLFAAWPGAVVWLGSWALLGLSALSTLSFIGSLIIFLLIGQARQYEQRVHRYATGVLEELARDQHVGLERIRGWLDTWAGIGLAPRMWMRGPCLPGVTMRPTYDPTSFAFTATLERAYEDIRSELIDLCQTDDTLADETYFFSEMIAWKSAPLMRHYHVNREIAGRCPKTMAVIQEITGGLARDVLLSVVGPGGRIVPHRDPGNLFLTCHLGISIPPGCGLAVDDEVLSWQEGRCLVFDSAFQHRVWNDSDRPRIALVVDILRPDITPVERAFFAKVLPRT
jgi:hypothetical protein